MKASIKIVTQEYTHLKKQRNLIHDILKDLTTKTEVNQNHFIKRNQPQWSTNNDLYDFLATIPHNLTNIGDLIENSLGVMKQMMIKAKDIILTSGAVKQELYVIGDFVVELVKEEEKSILDKVNLMLYNFANQKNDEIKDIFTISGHS
jgi:hypothetical protein